MSFYLTATMRTVYSFPESQALSLVGSPWIWAGTLVMHAGLWWAAAWFKRQPDGRDRMWLIAMVPAPMLILSVIATSHRLSEIIGSPSAFNIGMIASATWIALVLVGVVAFRTFYHGWEDWAWAADLAAIASWTAIGILPFTGVLQWAEIVLKYD
jgi:predicted transporter